MFSKFSFNDLASKASSAVKSVQKSTDDIYNSLNDAALGSEKPASGSAADRGRTGSMSGLFGSATESNEPPKRSQSMVGKDNLTDGEAPGQGQWAMGQRRKQPLDQKAPAATTSRPISTPPTHDSKTSGFGILSESSKKSAPPAATLKADNPSSSSSLSNSQVSIESSGYGTEKSESSFGGFGLDALKGKSIGGFTMDDLKAPDMSQFSMDSFKKPEMPSFDSSKLTESMKGDTAAGFSNFMSSTMSQVKSQMGVAEEKKEAFQGQVLPTQEPVTLSSKPSSRKASVKSITDMDQPAPVFETIRRSSKTSEKETKKIEPPEPVENPTFAVIAKKESNQEIKVEPVPEKKDETKVGHEIMPETLSELKIDTNLENMSKAGTKFQPNLESKVEQKTESKFDDRAQQKQEPKIEEKIPPKIEQKIEQKAKQAEQKTEQTKPKPVETKPAETKPKPEAQSVQSRLPSSLQGGFSSLQSSFKSNLPSALQSTTTTPPTSTPTPTNAKADPAKSPLSFGTIKDPPPFGSTLPESIRKQMEAVKSGGGGGNAATATATIQATVPAPHAFAASAPAPLHTNAVGAPRNVNSSAAAAAALQSASQSTNNSGATYLKDAKPGDRFTIPPALQGVFSPQPTTSAQLPKSLQGSLAAGGVPTSYGTQQQSIQSHRDIGIGFLPSSLQSNLPPALQQSGAGAAALRNNAPQSTYKALEQKAAPVPVALHSLPASLQAIQTPLNNTFASGTKSPALIPSGLPPALANSMPYQSTLSSGYAPLQFSPSNYTSNSHTANSYTSNSYTGNSYTSPKYGSSSESSAASINPGHESRPSAYSPRPRVAHSPGPSKYDEMLKKIEARMKNFNDGVPIDRPPLDSSHRPPADSPFRTAIAFESKPPFSSFQQPMFPRSGYTPSNTVETPKAKTVTVDSFTNTNRTYFREMTTNTQRLSTRDNASLTDRLHSRDAVTSTPPQPTRKDAVTFTPPPPVRKSSGTNTPVRQFVDHGTAPDKRVEYEYIENIVKERLKEEAAKNPPKPPPPNPPPAKPTEIKAQVHKQPSVSKEEATTQQTAFKPISSAPVTAAPKPVVAPTPTEPATRKDSIKKQEEETKKPPEPKKEKPVKQAPKPTSPPVQQTSPPQKAKQREGFTRHLSNSSGSTDPPDRPLSTGSLESCDMDSEELREFLSYFVTTLFEHPEQLQPAEKAKFADFVQSVSGRRLFAKQLESQKDLSERVTETTFLHLCQFCAICLFECHENEDFKPAKAIMDLSFAFYVEGMGGQSKNVRQQGQEPMKHYLYTYLRDQPIWASIHYWNASFFESVQADRAKFAGSESEDVDAIVINQLGTYMYFMKAFGASKDFCWDFTKKQGEQVGLSREHMAVLRSGVEQIFAQ